MKPQSLFQVMAIFLTGIIGLVRYGFQPFFAINRLKVDMPIDELVKMARSYGNAIGNEQKAETYEAEYNVQKPSDASFMGWSSSNLRNGKGMI